MRGMLQLGEGEGGWMGDGRGIGRSSDHSVGGKGRAQAYLLYMSWMSSSSASARAIFSAEDGCGRLPPKRKDIVVDDGEVCSTLNLGAVRRRWSAGLLMEDELVP